MGAALEVCQACVRRDAHTSRPVQARTCAIQATEEPVKTMELQALDYVVVLVDDLERAMLFYTQVLGLRLGHRSGHYAQLETGTTRLGLYTRSAMAQVVGFPLRQPRPDAPECELGFKVPDVDAAFAELVAHGVTTATPPTTRSWGQRTAYVRDPDGHLIELVQDLSTP